MSKLALTNRVTQAYNRQAMFEVFSSIQSKVNGLGEGRVYATHNAYTAAPTAGAYARGDFVKNSEPEEAGTTNDKYVILGWICVASGEPGTWLECRVLTGN
jgi:hypothetical protein